jgi:Endonuclease-reverse transcriptase
MRIMQWNAGRGLGDADNGILDVLAVEKGARVCLLQETVGFSPNGTVKALKESRRWSVFESGRASILVSQGVRAVECKRWARVAGVDGAVLDAVAVEVAGMGIAHPILLVSVYRDQTQNIPDAIEYLRELLFQLTAVSVIVGGDFNIHSKALGASQDGPQGEEFGSMVDELRELGGNCGNDGSPTWVGRVNRVAPCTPSHIDGTLFAPGLDWPIELRDWRTGDQSQSDHVTIYYDIVEQSSHGQNTPDHVTKRREHCHVQVPPPLNWFQLKRKACTEDRLNVFSVCAEAMARGDQGGLRSEPAKEFASRVLGEIQAAALHCGLIKPWAAKPKKGVFRTYGWTETCAEIYKARERRASS